MSKWFGMKRIKRQDSGYRQLKTKLFLVTVLTMFFSVAGAVFLYNFVFRGRFANVVVGFLHHIVYAGETDAYERARQTYRHVIRNYLDWYFGGGILFLFVIAQMIYIHCFVRYFTEINRGIDALITENAGDVILSQELAATERKINSIKHTLEKRKSDAQLAEQRKNDLVVYLAHDLKTPLTIIRGNAELLFDTSLSAEQRECAEYIENSSLQMQDYVQTLIEAAKSWDSYKPCMKKVNMDSLLLELKNQIGGLCAVNNISLHWDCGHYPAYITADHDLLIRMLINVLSNAVEHTPQGGEVIFEIEEHSNELSFLITDTGKGFSDEALKHATEQFFMDDDSRTSKSHYGIGLYVAASIAKKHNGKIILENSAVVGGAKVTIQIPY